MATIERIIPLLTYEDVATIDAATSGWSCMAMTSTRISSGLEPAAHASTASRSISRTASVNTARAIRKGIAGWFAAPVKKV